MSDRPSDRRPEGRRISGSYQGAVEAIVALLLAMGAGFWADQKFDTAPRYLLIGVVIGFGSFVLRLMRMRSLIEEPPDEEAPKEEAPKEEG